jgi:hypothetical protein
LISVSSGFSTVLLISMVIYGAVAILYPANEANG